MTTTTYTATSPINEILHWARNQDILTIAQRSVSTTTHSETLSSSSATLINRTNIKNIRSLTIAAVSKTLGTDYDYAVDYDDSGTIKTRITFVSAQSGALVVTYDYGSDKIFTDYPRDDLTITSYPRIVVDMLSENTDAYGIGGTAFIENPMFTFIVYDQDQDFIRSKIDSIKTKLRTSAKSFYNFPFVKQVSRGPIIKDEGRNQVILHGNIDAVGMFKITQL